MKILAIGDVHGTRHWKRALEEYRDKADWIVFMGDYFDNHRQYEDAALSGNAQIENFLEIIRAAKADSNITLLVGNHDNQYLYDPYERCSGYNAPYAMAIGEAISSNLAHLNAAFHDKNWLFTHAGLSRQLYEDTLSHLTAHDDDKPLSDILRILWLSHRLALFNIGKVRGGTADFPGIFWMDWHEEAPAMAWSGMNQCVGHTKRPSPEICRTDDGKAILLNVDVYDDAAVRFALIDTDTDEIELLP